MKQDYGELVEYLDKKFSSVDERFNSVDERFNSVDERFNSVDERFALVAKEVSNLRSDMDSGFSELKSDFRQLQNAVDAYAAKADKYFMEMVALAHKVDRLERWIQEIAEKVGIKLK